MKTLVNVPLLAVVLLTYLLLIKSQQCRPSGRIIGKKPPSECNHNNDADCCKEGQVYTTYRCSPPVTSRTKAFLTLNGFGSGEEGGSPSECDGHYHSDDTPVVALSTGWLDNMHKCFKNITIYGNGRSVVAMVVDECDSSMGCDEEHAYQPPCDNNIVDASRAVWKALGVPRDDWGGMDVSWSSHG